MKHKNRGLHDQNSIT